MQIQNILLLSDSLGEAPFGSVDLPETGVILHLEDSRSAKNLAASLRRLQLPGDPEITVRQMVIMVNASPDNRLILGEAELGAMFERVTDYLLKRGLIDEDWAKNIRDEFRKPKNPHHLSLLGVPTQGIGRSN